MVSPEEPRGPRKTGPTKHLQRSGREDVLSEELRFGDGEMRNEGRVENLGVISKKEEELGVGFCPGPSPQAHH